MLRFGFVRSKLRCTSMPNMLDLMLFFARHYNHRASNYDSQQVVEYGPMYIGINLI